MADKDLIVDFSEYSLDRVIARADDIRGVNPQRFEMEQLTAVVHEDTERKICVGYKDVTHEEFWIRGHMPRFPLMPGVMICEAAAQLSSYFCQRHAFMGCDLIGFGGLDEVRFRGSVVPGDRLVMAIQCLKVRRRAMIQSRFQAFVRHSLVAEGKLLGVALTIDPPRSEAIDIVEPEYSSSIQHDQQAITGAATSQQSAIA